MSARKITRITLAMLLVAAAATGTTLALKHLHPAKRGVPTIRVARGNLDLKIYTTGELRAGTTAMLVAPSVGTSLHLIFLAKTGTHVKSGDLVADFDPSDQEHNMEVASSDLKEAEQSIAKAKADASVQDSQDKVDLLKAGFDVRRAEMDVSKKDLVSAIEAKKNLLALDEARRHLSQLKEDIPSHAASNQAEIAVAEEKLAKARLSMELAQKNIQNMHLRAPMDGLVAVQENRQTNFYFSGMRLPEYREGDEVQPGGFVAQVLDVEQMELQGKVAEIDRANLSPGEPANIEIYALPHQKISGRVKDVAGTALQSAFFSDSGSSKFGVVIALDHPDPQLRPGLSGVVTISAGEIKGVLYLPPQAIFAKNGNPVAYVRKGSDFAPQKIKITRRSETRIAVEGLAEGTEVALVNPEQETTKTSAVAPASPSLGGGRQ
jgi:multidrug resistance efflux pump